MKGIHCRMTMAIDILNDPYFDLKTAHFALL